MGFLMSVPKKYEHIDFRPPQGVADSAAKGLGYRQKASPSNRGGLTPAEAAKEGVGSGVQRAVNLKNQVNISPNVIRQMYRFFKRHRKNRLIADKHKSTPWNDKGYVSWLLWGGDPGETWVNKIIRQMDAADEKAKTASIVSLWIRKSKLRVSPNWVSDPTSKADKDDKVRMWDLYSISYGGIGGQAASISSLMEQFDLVMHRDMDGDGEIDAFIGFKQTHAGNKLVLMGSDGTSRAKRDVIMKSMSLLKSSGWYAELSGKPAMLALQEGVPVVEDEQLVREVLRKPLDWHGGSYTRVISGLGSHKKWLFGRPNMSKSAASGHDAQVELMKFMSGVARRHGVAKHIYIVGGAVRNFVLGQPIKDVDVVVDSVALGGKDSEWFASLLKREIPAATKLVTNQYGVAIITVTGTWQLNGADLTGEVIEIANARKESYGGGEGKGYKPSHVVPATIEEDVLRREFNFNTLLWSLMDLTSGPDKAEIIDLTGCGMQDLRKGIMQCPRDPDIVFSDDPTRMLRAIKFMAKYGFKIPADVADSIKRNARKMKSVPWEAIATLFIQNVLNEPTAGKALRVMKSLGLLDVVGEMADATPAFHTYLTRELRGRHASLLLELLDLGFTQATPLKFLTPAQRGAFLDMARGMDRDEVNGILRALEKPEIDNQSFIREYNLQGPERSIPLSMARELILGDPSLANRRDALNQAIRLRLGMR
jgi:tRNA nucleotidyltransferase/poly(A) polymerase